MNRVVFPLLSAMFLAACGGTTVSDYARVPVSDFRVGGENWTVSDMTYRSRMLVGPDTGDFSDGLLKTYSLDDHKIPPERYEAVALAWLKVNHRGHCIIEDDDMVDWPRFEVVYSCAGEEMFAQRPSSAIPGAPAPQQQTLPLPFAETPSAAPAMQAPGTLPPYQRGTTAPSSGSQPGTLPPYQSAPQQTPAAKPQAKPWDNFPK